MPVLFLYSPRFMEGTVVMTMSNTLCVTSSDPVLWRHLAKDHGKLSSCITTLSFRLILDNKNNN